MKKIIILILLIFSFPLTKEITGENKYFFWESNLEKHKGEYLFTFTFSLKEKFHINSNQPFNENYIPTILTIKDNPFYRLNKLQYPIPVISEYYKESLSVYEGSEEKTIKAYLIPQKSSLSPEKINLSAVFSFQPCDDKFCFPPEKLAINVEKKLTTISKSNTNFNTFPENLSIILLWAFLGGLLLNFMPCIFPLLSLKAYSLVKTLNEEKVSIKKKGVIAFSLGTVVSFLALAGIFVILKQWGEQINWGIQFQNPFYLTLFILLFWILALNLLEVFHLNSAINYSLTPSSKSYHIIKENFITGLFLPLLSSSCIAPFLGVAISYALTQSSLTVFVFFLIISLGFISPYLLILTPINFQKIIPAPGPWLKSFKQLNAFPLFLMIIWFLSILYSLANFAVVVNVLLLLCFFSLLFFIWGGIQKKPKVLMKKYYSWGFYGLVVVVSAIFLVYQNFTYQNNQNANLNKIIIGEKTSQDNNLLTPELFREQLLKEKTFYVHYTAKWCLNCQVNKVVLNQEEVKNFFKENGINYFTADWTKPNSFIANKIQELNRVGIPLDVFYAFQNGQLTPYILPVILTESNIKKTFQKINHLQ